MQKRIKRMLPILFVFTLIAVLGKGSLNIAAKTASDYSVQVSTNRKAATCDYQVNGLDLSETSSMEMTVSYTNSNGETITALKQQMMVNASNCKDGVYTGSFSMEDFDIKDYAKYKVSFAIGDVIVDAKDSCDFSIHTDKCKVSVDANTDSTKRKVLLTSTEDAGNVIIPGSNNTVNVFVWKKGASESEAVVAEDEKVLTNTSQAWTINVTKACSGYGTYYAKIAFADGTQTIGKSTFKVVPKATTLKTKKSKALEKKQAFAVSMTGFSAPFTAKKVYFDVYNSKGTKVYTKTATAKSKSSYYAEINMKALNYKFDKYKIKVSAKDANGETVQLSKSASVTQKPSAKSLTIKKSKATRSSTFNLKNAYIPGNIKSVRFLVYQKANGKETLFRKVTATYKSSSNTYTATIKNKKAGTFVVYAYGYTNWGKKVLMKKKSVKITKAEVVRNGWYYEKYNGKTYKFYYKNDKKVTDLTKILKLNKSHNKLYIEINRAACCVTVYAYDSVKKKYIIPVKTFTVSVGRDVSTVAGAGALNIHSSFTPIGTFSICTNGTSVKYSLKPMYEPDGSTVYSRWTSHIVGNVYFHSIAVGSQSHYALNPNTYNRLGSPASAGCIRMTVAGAKWIYDYASTGTPVKIVTGSSKYPGPLGKEKTIKVTSSIHYDPTDPEVPDSTKKKDYAAGRISGYMTKSGKKVGY